MLLKRKGINRNGKLGIDKRNNYIYVPNAPRRLCQNCDSSNHLNHAWKIRVSKGPKFTCKYKVPFKDKDYAFCDKFDCMLCNFNVMTRCFNLIKKFVDGCISQTQSIHEQVSSSLLVLRKLGRNKCLQSLRVYTQRHQLRTWRQGRNLIKRIRVIMIKLLLRH